MVCFEMESFFTENSFFLNRLQASGNTVNLCDSPTGEDSGLDELSEDNQALIAPVKYNMRKSLDLDQDGCYLQTGTKECLEECGFNATAKTIFIIHGWTVSLNVVWVTLDKLQTSPLTE